jgi:hypothetical protein
MLDFTPLRNQKIKWPEFAEGLTKEDLVKQVNEMTDKILELIQGCSDADVVFEPHDPDAHDPYAENPEDVDLSWSLGHVIVHLTASSEESAFLAAESARGVEYEPRRSRWEVPWETVTTVDQCRKRLKESRRMLLASLEIWPDDAHLNNAYKTSSGIEVTPIIRFLFGQNHAYGHLRQIEETVQQAQEAAVV